VKAKIQPGIDFKEKVSLIMPAFNAENYVANAIQSCLDQTYENWELIIVDDCSSDSTIDVIRKHNDPRIKLYELDANSGPGRARNTGLEKCTGEWITVLDADDAICLNRVETFIHVAATTGENFVYYDDLLPCTNQDTIPTIFDKKSENYTVDKNRQLTLNQWLLKDGYAKPFFHRSLLLDGSIRYPESIRGPEDTVFLVKLCAVNNVPLIKLATRSYVYRETPGSLSNRGKKQILANKAAHALLDEISIEFPSINSGVKEFARKNSDFENFLLIRELLVGRKYGRFLRRVFLHPKDLLIVMRKIEEKFLYEFLRISRNLSRTLGNKLTMGNRSGV
jgi:succinoglycan biosynthesis protein ExoO